MRANDVQVGGDHYKKHGATGQEQHWDRVARLGLDYFQGQITKYVERWKDKGGLQDLRKAQHFLQKYIELEAATDPPVVPACVHEFDVFHGPNKTVELCVRCFEPKETT